MGRPSAEMLQSAITAHQTGLLDEAENLYRQTLAMSPESFDAHWNLGALYQGLGRWDEAAGQYRTALGLKPDYAEGYDALAKLYQEQGRFEEAMAVYQAALKHTIDLPGTLYRLAMMLARLGRWEEVVMSLQIVLELQPEHDEAMFEIGNALYQQGKRDEALAYYEKAINLKPDQLFYEMRRFTACPMMLMHAGQAEDFRRQAMGKLQESMGKVETWPDIQDIERYNVEPSFYQIYHGLDERPLKEAFGAFYERLFQDRYPSLMIPHTGSGCDKPKIAFLVTYRHEGIFCKLNLGFLNHLSRDLFDVTVVCGSQTSASAIASQCREPNTRYLVMPGSLYAMAERVRQEHFDAVFHFEIGTDAHNYYLPFFRLAPVQFSSIGFPVTSGIPGVNYFLTSDLIELPEAEAHYSEALVRLSTMPVYFYRPAQSKLPKNRRDFGLSVDKTLYICPQSLFKLHPDFDPILAEILKQDSRAEIHLLQLKGELERHLVSRLASNPLMQTVENWQDRIRWIPRLSSQDYLDYIALGDVMLDPTHVNGGITSHEGLAMGIPIVTLPSRYFRGRMTQGCYQAMGMMECIADSPEQYVEIAMRLGMDADYRESVQQEIRERSDVLFENMQAVRELERFLLSAIEGSGQKESKNPGGAK